MTSFLVCKKMSLSRKWCMMEMRLLLNTNGKPLSPIQILSSRTVHSAPHGYILVTSLSVCKKTSLSRKQCVIDEKCLWNTTRKPQSAFQNPSFQTAYSDPQRIQHHDVIAGLQENVIISETVRDRNKVNSEHQQETYIALSNSVVENCTQRPLAESGDISMTSFSVCKKTSLSRKRCMTDENLLWNTNRKP